VLFGEGTMLGCTANLVVTGGDIDVFAEEEPLR